MRQRADMDCRNEVVDTMTPSNVEDAVIGTCSDNPVAAVSAPWSNSSARSHWLARLALHCSLRLGSVVLVAAVAIALVRYGPGFETDERDLDPTLSLAARGAIHAERSPELRFFTYAKTFIRASLRGDLGTSRALGVPVRQLLAERGPATLHILLLGTTGAWAGGCLWATACVLTGKRIFSVCSSLVNAIILCLPTAALAALILQVGWPPEAILCLVLLPKIFQVTRGLLREAVQQPQILAAHARGLHRLRILGWYVLPAVSGQLLAWLMASISLAIGALVPIEVICDVPGLGQLAWKAALARDLPVLVVLTLVIGLVIQISNGLGWLASAAMHRELT
jgi:peptide/nickel transport system permease protein